MILIIELFKADYHTFTAMSAGSRLPPRREAVPPSATPVGLCRHILPSWMHQGIEFSDSSKYLVMASHTSRSGNGIRLPLGSGLSTRFPPSSWSPTSSASRLNTLLYIFSSTARFISGTGRWRYTMVQRPMVMVSIGDSVAMLVTRVCNWDKIRANVRTREHCSALAGLAVFMIFKQARGCSFVYFGSYGSSAVRTRSTRWSPLLFRGEWSAGVRPGKAIQGPAIGACDVYFHASAGQ